MTTGEAAIFAVRALLTALGSPNWGIYSGYEFIENVQCPGFEEQNDNEKYEFRPRKWEETESIGIAKLLTFLNAAKTRHPTLRQLHSLKVRPTSRPGIICFSKQIPARFTESGQPDTVICVVSLDPRQGVSGTVKIDIFSLGASAPGSLFKVVDELDGRTYTWGTNSWVGLSPVTRLSHVFSAELTTDFDP